MNPNLKGILWMLLSCIAASVMVTLVRYIAQSFPVTEVVFFRNAFALLFMLPTFLRYHAQILHTVQKRKHLLRSSTGLIAMYLWFYSLTLVPLATAVSLSFTVNILTPVLAIFFFGEIFGPRRWAAIAAGFLGVLIILRPGLDSFDPHMLIVMASVLCWSFSGIFIKSLTRRDHPRVVAFYVALLMTPLSLPLALYSWITPTWEQLGWLLALGFVANSFQIALAHAIAAAPFSVIIPFDFTRLVFTAVLAYSIFGEIPDTATWVGGSVIMAASIYTAWREARTGKGIKTVEALD